jgi:hypothetical protein
VVVEVQLIILWFKPDCGMIQRYSRDIFLSFVFLVFCFSMDAQSLMVKGTVKDSLTLNPLNYVTVKAVEGAKGVLTNSGGFFQLPVGQQKTKIRFSSVGYETREIWVELSEKKDLVIYL